MDILNYGPFMLYMLERRMLKDCSADGHIHNASSATLSLVLKCFLAISENKAPAPGIHWLPSSSLGCFVSVDRSQFGQDGFDYDMSGFALPRLLR
jgi:hypothetical protein